MASMNIAEYWPPFALNLRSGNMELSPVRDSDLPELARIASGGVRRDRVQAFLVDWDSGSDAEITRSLAQYHWNTRATLTVESWTIEFTVRVGGEIIGVQGVSAQQFPLTRTLSTGSWLRKDRQGQGSGTRMRSLVVGAFIREFGARRFDTGYIDGNTASRRVSEKVGYSPNGTRSIVAQDGTASTEKLMVLFSEDYRHTMDDIDVSGAEEVRAFLGLTD